MTTVRLAAKLPDDNEINGLDHWAETLRKEPMQQMVAVAYIDVQKLITNYEKAVVQPVVQVVAIEVLGRPDEIPQAVRDAFLAAHDRRVNKTPLPFEDEPVDDFDEGPACTCGHPFGDHDVDTRACCADAACPCWEFSGADGEAA